MAPNRRPPPVEKIGSPHRQSANRCPPRGCPTVGPQVAVIHRMYANGGSTQGVFHGRSQTTDSHRGCTTEVAQRGLLIRVVPRAGAHQDRPPWSHTEDRTQGLAHTGTTQGPQRGPPPGFPTGVSYPGSHSGIPPPVVVQRGSPTGDCPPGVVQRGDHRGSPTVGPKPVVPRRDNPPGLPNRESPTGGSHQNYTTGVSTSESHTGGTPQGVPYLGFPTSVPHRGSHTRCPPTGSPTGVPIPRQPHLM